VFSDVEVGVRMCSDRGQEKGRAGEGRLTGRVESLNVHGAAVAFGGRGILILGASGAGKSALALDLIGRGAALVADDRVDVRPCGGALVARAPAALAGLVEARGVGLLRLPAAPEVPLVLAVDLDRTPAARMPQRLTITYLGIAIELISGRDVPNLGLVLTICVQNGRAVTD
jgi:HPr kinase/phosphorylase